MCDAPKFRGDGRSIGKPRPSRAEAEARRRLPSEAVAVMRAELEKSIYAPFRNKPDDGKDWYSPETKEKPRMSRQTETAHVLELVQDEPVARRAGPEIVSAADFLATDFSEPEWLVDGMIPAGGTVLLSGMPKSGKTTLARQLALTASRGAPFLGRDTGVWGGAREEGSRVLYMALQGRKQGAWQAFKDMGMQPGDEIDFVFEGPPNGQRQWLRAAIEKAEASVVVIDMLFTLFGVKEISEYGEMNTVMNQIVDVSKSTGATIISLHHSPKNGGSSYLGSTAIRGSYDTGIFLKRDETGGSVQTDQREGEDMPSIRLKLDPVTKTFSTGMVLHAERRNQLADDLMAFIGGFKNDLPSQEEVIKGVPGNKQAKLRTLNDLVEDGRIERFGSGNRNSPFTCASKAV